MNPQNMSNIVQRCMYYAIKGDVRSYPEHPWGLWTHVCSFGKFQKFGPFYPQFVKTC